MTIEHDCCDVQADENGKDVEGLFHVGERVRDRHVGPGDGFAAVHAHGGECAAPHAAGVQRQQVRPVHQPQRRPVAEGDGLALGAAAGKPAVVVFIGADYVDTEPEARVYLKKFGITFSNGPDLGTQMSQYFRIKGVPETYFIDQNGVLQYVQVGPFTSLDQIQAIIDPLLAGK